MIIFAVESGRAAVHARREVYRSTYICKVERERESGLNTGENSSNRSEEATLATNKLTCHRSINAAEPSVFTATRWPSAESVGVAGQLLEYVLCFANHLTSLDTII